ncbi:hypothetical protein RKLH11_4020 [Rhodobacteraceae bacterium KLH11]|nr:hypothetical protein RKLH11_4020 [Rhodobacteraceae bacterium KLH11]
MSGYGFPTSQPEGIGSFPVPVILTSGERDFGTPDESPVIIRAPQQATKAARENANGWPVVNCRSRPPKRPGRNLPSGRPIPGYDARRLMVKVTLTMSKFS